MPSKFVLDKSFYTYNFYNKARNVITEKYPIVVPSYNSAKYSRFLNFVKNNTTENDYWPIYLVVRNSQKAAYEETYSNIPGITFIAMEDTLINNSGKVRREINNYFTGKYKTIFVMDDDVIPRFMARAVRAEDSTDRYFYDKSMSNVVNLFSMWQVSHDWLMKKHPHAIMSFLYNIDFIFEMKYGLDHAYTLGGKAGCAMAIELNRLKAIDLNYLSNDEINGAFDDADLIVRGLEKKVYPIKIAFMTCDYIKMSLNVRGTQDKDRDNRVRRQWQALYDLYNNNNYLKINKKGNLLIGWRKFFRENYPNVDTNGSIYDAIK